VQDIAALTVDPERARIFEHGWSPTQVYPLTATPHRPVSEHRTLTNYRPDRRAPVDAFWGEGLLAVDPGAGAPVHVFAAADPAQSPSIRADVQGAQVVVRAEPGTRHHTDDGPGGLTGALARWAEDIARTAGVGEIRAAPTLWCSWYHYFTRVTEADIDENLLAIEELDLPIDVVQIDDGYQAELGDWLELSERFRSLRDVVARIHDRGRRAGIWVAPFLVGHKSEVFRDHQHWLLDGASAGYGWEQDLAALDAASPGGEGYLRRVFETLADVGFDFYKLDFGYAGALGGVAAYRHGLRVIRESVGPEAYVLGCGAPILPSVGLVDAMRVSPDISHHVEPSDGDQSQPSQRAATRSGRARAWMHGRFWVNDPDCLIAASSMQDRERWAEHVAAYGGLRASSDRLRELDGWGLHATRDLLRPVPATPFEPTRTATGPV